MKLPELPASIQTQLAMYDSTIADAEAKKATAELERKEMLDAFYGLKGKLVRAEHKHHRAGLRVTHMRVDNVLYDTAGAPRELEGRRVKNDGEPSRYADRVYCREMREPHIRVVDSVDAP